MEPILLYYCTACLKACRVSCLFLMGKGSAELRYCNQCKTQECLNTDCPTAVCYVNDCNKEVANGYA